MFLLVLSPLLFYRHVSLLIHLVSLWVLNLYLALLLLSHQYHTPYFQAFICIFCTSSFLSHAFLFEIIIASNLCFSSNSTLDSLISSPEQISPISLSISNLTSLPLSYLLFFFWLLSSSSWKMSNIFMILTSPIS